MKLLCSLASLTLLTACIADIGPSPDDDPIGGSPGGGAIIDFAAPGPDGTSGGGAGQPAATPSQYTPCEDGACWQAPGVTATCGQLQLGEDFSSGKYNVHVRPLQVPAGVSVEVALEQAAGAFSPALLVADPNGTILYDGQVAATGGEVQITPLATGQDAAGASLRILATNDTSVQLFTTSWSVVDSGFTAPMPADAAYLLGLDTACDPGDPGGLLSPPNLDPNDVVDGFYLLPQSDPPGLYTRKADGCSRGTKRLIDVLYTVAAHFQQLRPSLAPITILDLNEGPCSTVDHATHDDGTHVDIMAGCATEVACADNGPAIDLAKLFVDTGVACGIINNDTAVQAEVNAYFNSQLSYQPWHGTFMRSVSGHTHHFHVRVMKPDGKCN